MTARRLPAPRWQTPMPPGVVGSWGPFVADYAEQVLRIRLDLWQRRVLNRALAYGADGRLVHRLYLASAARQNGKTSIVRALIGWFLTGRWVPPSWHRALGLAHDRTQARVPYELVREDLLDIERRVGSELRGGLALTRYLGLRSAMFGQRRIYTTASREARNAVRTFTLDLIVFDELRTQVNRDAWAAVEPTTTARPDPLVFGISTAGSDRSVLLREWWELGVAIIEGREPFRGFGMTWYAAADEDAAATEGPGLARAIRAANPSLAEGRLSVAGVIGSGTIRPGTPEWVQERLNLWTDSADEWLPAGTWRRQTAAAQPAPAGRIVLGVEAVPSWRRVTITAAIVTDSGVWVGVADELDASRELAASISPAQLIELLRKTAAAWQPDLVTYSGSAAAAPHVEAWAESSGQLAHALTPRDIRSASQLLRSELIGGRLWHPDDPLLGLQVRGARPSAAVEGGDWYISVRDSLGEVDAIRAAAWAAWGAISPEAPVLGPQVFA